MWEIYYSDIDGLVYIIDSTRNIQEQIEVLNIVLDNKYIKKSELPVLVLINKTDITPFEDFKLFNNLLNFEKINQKSYNVMVISAIEGRGIKESLNWLYYSMCNTLFNDQNLDNFDPMLNLA